MTWLIGRRTKKEKGRRIPHLKETFPVPAKVIIAEEVVLPQCRLAINALDNEETGEGNTIRHASGDEMLRNWTFEPVIDVFASK